MPTPKLTDAELQATVDAHAAEGGSVSKAAAKLGIGQSTFGQRIRLAKERGLTPQAAGAEKPAAKRVGLSLGDFRERYDKSYYIPERIRDGLKRMGEDGTDCMYEAQFASFASVSPQDLGNHRDGFSEYVVVLNRDGRRAWAKTPKVAAEMRKMIGLV